MYQPYFMVVLDFLHFWLIMLLSVKRIGPRCFCLKLSKLKKLFAYGSEVTFSCWMRTLYLDPEALAWRCFVIKVSLKISQNSQENTCARVSFLINLLKAFLFDINFSLISGTTTNILSRFSSQGTLGIFVRSPVSLNISFG